MTKEENIRAILECNFAGMKDEIIDIAVSRIMLLDQDSSENMISRKVAYEQGLNDAWECARKIGNNSWTGLTYEIGFKDLDSSINASWDCVMKYSASEAIEKIKEWEEKQDDTEIIVGDEVYYCDINHKRVVTSIFTVNGEKTKAVQLTESGKVAVDDVDELNKTGRHYDIESILKQMQEVEE